MSKQNLSLFLMKGLREIFRYTFQYRGLAILVIVFNVLTTVFNLISLALFVPFLQVIFGEKVDPSTLVEPTYSGGFSNFFKYCSDWYQFEMNSMAVNDPKGALLFVVISVGIAFFLKNLTRYIVIWFQSKLRTAVMRDFRDKLFEKCMRLPMSYFSNERKGDLLSRMQADVAEMELAVVSTLELVFRDPLSIIIHLALLIYWSPQLTLFSVILLPVSAFIISRIGKSLKRTTKKEKSQLGLVMSFLEEKLGGIRIIKAFNAEKEVEANFNRENLHHQKLITRSFRKRDLTQPLNETLGTIVLLVIVWYGGSLILGKESNSLTPQVFMGFVVVFTQLLRPISAISQGTSNLNRAQASLDRINEVLDSDEEIYEVENAHPLSELNEKIEYKNVGFKYKDDFVLRNINFSIPKGKTVALVGESGSGKSTLADLLPRFYDIQEGEILFDNINIKEASITDLRDHLGIVTQESILFNATVAENISFGSPNATREQIIEASKIANADRFITDLENGYDTNIGERGNKLSGGQRQRISIARAVLKDPPILILDEATSALDTESEKLVQDALSSLMKNRTSLVIAHRLSTIQNADEIIVLSKGEIVERGSHQELLEKKGVYHKLSSMQGMIS